MKRAAVPAIIAILAIAGASLLRPQTQQLEAPPADVERTEQAPIALVDRERPPQPPPPTPPPVTSAGTKVVVNLSEPPTDWYLRGATTGNERFYRTLIGTLSDGDVFLSADLAERRASLSFNTLSWVESRRRTSAISCSPPPARSRRTPRFNTCEPTHYAARRCKTASPASSATHRMVTAR